MLRIGNIDSDNVFFDTLTRGQQCDGEWVAGIRSAAGLSGTPRCSFAGLGGATQPTCYEEHYRVLPSVRARD